MDYRKDAEFKSVLNQVFNNVKASFSVANLDYLPRWIILTIDMIIVLMSGIITYFLMDGMGLDYVMEGYVIFSSVLYFVVSLFFFWLFKIYSGIIRHSSYIDAVKIFFSQISTLSVFTLVNVIFILAHKGKIVLNTGLFINFVITFCALFFYRVLVKQVFERYFSENDDIVLIPAMIYGSDANAISVANALKFEMPNRFKILGFIDKENKNITKRILDLPIVFENKRVSVLMRASGAQALIIADKGLTNEERIRIVEECLEFNMKVYSVPLITDWEDQKEISKKVKTFQIQDLLERKPIVLDNNLISNKTKGKTILITGAAGSIGSEIVRQIIHFNPASIILLDQAETPLHHLSLRLSKSISPVKVITVIADIRDKEVLQKVFEKYKPDVVYHAAAYKHVPLMELHPSQAVLTNIIGTKNLADLSYQFNVSDFVMISTDKAVNPSNVMGASKRIAEKYVQSLSFKLQKENRNTTKYITTRFGNVLGSNGSVVPLFTEQIAHGGPVTITHPDIIRYFMTIPEACQLVLEAGTMGKGGEVFIFDMGEPVKIIDLANKMIRLAGFIPNKDIEIKVVGLRPGEKLYEELLNTCSKTLMTHHEKILIAQEDCEEYDIVNGAIENLYLESKSFDSKAIVSSMKKIVPEFKSMNSVFEHLDN